VHDFAEGLAKQDSRDNCCGEQQRGNRQCYSKQARRPSFGSRRNCCSEWYAVLVSECAPTFDFQQAFADHLRQHDQIFWPFIGVPI
jgi:hypothetical protein